MQKELAIRMKAARKTLVVAQKLNDLDFSFRYVISVFLVCRICPEYFVYLVCLFWSVIVYFEFILYASGIFL